MGLLEGKKALVMGVGNKRSIAWGIATAFQREGAELAFNWPNDRLKDNVLELVATLPNHESVPVGACDVSKQEEIDKFFAEIDRRWGKLDILVHSIAFAAIEDLKGRFHEISREGLKTAIDVSAYSLVALSRAALPLFDKAGGGSVMSLTYNAVERVVPSYNSMAMAKAVLEAETRYLAADLGPHNVRVNAISAGPLKTLSGSAARYPVVTPVSAVAQRLGCCPTCSARRRTLQVELVAAPAGHDRVPERGVQRDDRGIRRTRVDLAIAIGPGPAMYAELEQPADTSSAVLRKHAGDQDAQHVLA